MVADCSAVGAQAKLILCADFMPAAENSENRPSADD
jgi:hypothetical protein